MSITRRAFMQNTAITGLGLGLTGQTKSLAQPVSKPKASKINVAILGSGLRGQSHIELLLKRDDCNIVAIAEPDKVMVERSKEIFSKQDASLPKFYSNGDQDYRNLIAKEDIDAAVIASPWRWHTEMAVACMQAKIFVGLEVCGGFSIDECWQLVNTYEATGTPLFFLENVCYRRDVMAILNMVRQNMFGELIHLEGGYQHDLRGVKFNDGVTPYNSGVEYGSKGFSEAKWRTQHSIKRDGDLYPTHGVGPVAQYININKGNRFLYLSSMSTKSRGLHNYIVNHEKGGANHPNAKLEFKLGDKVTTMIKCANGESIVLHHDTSLPRPYSLGFRVQGTKGLWMAVNKSLHIEGVSPSHRWEDAEPYLKKYDHPLWKRHEAKAVGAGHGGMDFFVLHAFVECAKKFENPPFDVYDAASWLAITPLSEQSVNMGSTSVPFPDFTRGRWIDTANTFAVSDEY